MIDEIKKHFEKEYPREGCGIIGIVKGKKEWFPCENVALEDNNFILSSSDYLKIKRKADIFAIVHSHPDASSEASEHDINCCNALGVSYYIFSYPDMDLNIIEPKKKAYPLIGREYEFGVKDCFEAMRDYLESKGITIPSRVPFERNWWDRELNYFCPEVIEKWGGEEIPLSDIKPNDVLIFKIRHSVPDHCGVYLGNDIFFHHAEKRLSCRENLYPFWGEHLVGAYRYVT